MFHDMFCNQTTFFMSFVQSEWYSQNHIKMEKKWYAAMEDISEHDNGIKPNQLTTTAGHRLQTNQTRDHSTEYP